MVEKRRQQEDLWGISNATTAVTEKSPENQELQVISTRKNVAEYSLASVILPTLIVRFRVGSTIQAVKFIHRFTGGKRLFDPLLCSSRESSADRLQSSMHRTEGSELKNSFDDFTTAFSSSSSSSAFK
ncbi:hypothetical protein BY996DRAFT_6529628 [Phakopsora pachyrhizi]|nr:hypothetical protein BY996DRAFT_6529628 [Phakopsora pachyrhizi]